MGKEKPIIFVDIDDTLADTRQGVYDLYSSITGDYSGDINIKSKNYADFCPLWTHEQVYKLFADGKVLYEIIKPLPKAVEAIEVLINRGYDVRIVTIQQPSGVAAKQKWIDRYFPKLSKKVYYVTHYNLGKDTFNGYSIVDDDLRNIKNNKSLKPILIDYYNIYDEEGYIKVSNWDGALAIL